MSNTSLKIGIFGLLALMLSAAAFAASGTLGIGQSLYSNGMTSGGNVGANVSVYAHGNSSNSISGIFVNIGNSISGGLNSVASFFSNIWISIKAYLHF